MLTVFRQSTQGGLPACPSCGTVLPPEADTCPACNKSIGPLKNLNTLDSRLGPRTDVPLSAMSQAASSEASQPLPNFLPERYEIIKLLGQGGMGAVYHCIDKQLDRPVAIKVMTDKFRASPQSETRFMREARAQAIVNHRNVSTILNFGVSAEGKLFLVMEYLEGEDLREFIRKMGPIEPMLACEMMRQACDGLQEAHACGLVHRDLKPSNLMIVRDHRGQPWVKILDLGLAKMVGGQTDLMTITMDTANQLIGTPAYMSPEQVAGSNVDSRADLYSMGVVFYEMLAGKLPFESESLPGWLYQHLHELPEPITSRNPELEKFPHISRLPMWMLEKRPEDRPQSAGEVASILKSILAGKLPGSDNSARESGARDATGTPGSNSKLGAAGTPVQGSPRVPSDPKPTKFSSVPAADRNRPPLMGVLRRPGLALPKLVSGPGAGLGQAPAGIKPRGIVPTPSNPFGRSATKAPVQQVQVLNAQMNVSSVAGLDPEQARKEHEQAVADAMKAESGNQWRTALKHWTKAQALVEHYPGLESVAGRLEISKREVEFEDSINKSDAAARTGDWQTADEMLVQLTSPQGLDPRLEQAKASLPKRLISAWMEQAVQRIRILPEGDFRRELVEHYTIVAASSGDMPGAINFLDSSPRRAEERIVTCAQAVSAGVKHGHAEGMRPYLDRLQGDLATLTNPAERGKASLEVGRALAVYGDLESAAACLRDAFRLFGEALAQNVPIAVSDRTIPTDRLRTPSVSQSQITSLASGKTGTLAKSVRSSWLTAISAVADAQAEAGLVDDCLKSASTIDDPWTKALVLSQLVQNFTKAGRHDLAERQAAIITFALPKTQALRQIAISKVYREDILGAEELLAAIPTPTERLPILGCMAVYFALRKDPTKPRTLIANMLTLSKQINSALPRFNALAAAVEPMLSAGFNDMARSIFDEAQQLIPSIDDPAERLRCILQLVKMKEARREVTQAVTRTVAFAGRPATHLLDMLRQALFTARQLRNGSERLGCLEMIATRITAAYLPILASEMFAAFREEQDQAAIYIGLCAGMV